MRENIKNYLTDDEIKTELAVMLSQFDKWAEENNLKYSIFAGTLLGSVRHNGFIPWDDDIDVCMDRHSYNDLLKILRKNNDLGNDLYGCGFELNNCDMPFVKIKNRNIECYEQPYFFDDDIQIKTNLWIDVFPIDGFPDRFGVLYEKMRNVALGLFYQKREIYYGWHNDNSTKRSFLGEMKQYLLKRIPYSNIIKLVIKVSALFDINCVNTVSSNLWGLGIKEVFPRAWLNEYKEYSFEGYTVKGIKEGEKWLSIRYGDYLKLPPVEQRETHGIKAWRVDKEKKNV